MNPYNPDNTWFSDLALSQKSEPLIDNIYSIAFPYHNNINRIKPTQQNYTKGSKNSLLDKDLHIDTILSSDLHGQISLQEKVLRYEFSKYNTFTMEYLQDVNTKEKGEFFTITSQFYFSGYLNEKQTNFDKWIIIDLARFISYPAKMIQPCQIKKPKSSNASFICWNYNDIPEDCIYLYSN